MGLFFLLLFKFFIEQYAKLMTTAQLSLAESEYYAVKIPLFPLQKEINISLSPIFLHPIKGMQAFTFSLSKHNLIS